MLYRVMKTKDALRLMVPRYCGDLRLSAGCWPPPLTWRLAGVSGRTPQLETLPNSTFPGLLAPMQITRPQIAGLSAKAVETTVAKCNQLVLADSTRSLVGLEPPAGACLPLVATK